MPTLLLCLKRVALARTTFQIFLVLFADQVYPKDLNISTYSKNPIPSIMLGAFQCASPIMSILTDFKAGEYCLPGTGEEFCWGQSRP